MGQCYLVTVRLFKASVCVCEKTNCQHVPPATINVAYLVITPCHSSSQPGSPFYCWWKLEVSGVPEYLPVSVIPWTSYAHTRTQIHSHRPPWTQGALSFFLSFPPFSCCLFWSTGGLFPQCCCSHGYRHGDSEWGVGVAFVGLTESGRDSIALFEEIGGYVTVGEGGSDAG